MSNELYEIWFNLTASPLFGLSLTILVYLVGRRLHRLSGDNPLCNPVAIAIVVLIAVLGLTETPYPTYFEGAQFVHFLLVLESGNSSTIN
jgi:putative effector of murein hydrolase